MKPPHIEAEDNDPVFQLFFTATMSRGRARRLLKDMDAAGFMVVRKPDPQTAPTPEDVSKMLSRAALAVAEKRG